MKSSVLSACALVLSLYALPSTGMCQETPSRQDSLIASEKYAWEKERLNDGAFFDSVMTEDFLALEADGNWYTKQEVVRLIPTGSPFTFVLSNFRVIAVSDEAAIVSYSAEVAFLNEQGSGKTKFAASSVWIREKGVWRLKFHQKSLLDD